MRLIILTLLMVMMASSAFALWFDIGPAAGYTEPLSTGDVIEITATTEPSPGHDFALSSWRLFYDSVFLGEVTIPGWPFTIDSYGFVTGSAALDVGINEAANHVELHIATTFPPFMYHWYSNNLLEVQPTAPMTPATGVAGLVLLLLAVPAYLLWRR